MLSDISITTTAFYFCFCLQGISLSSLYFQSLCVCKSEMSIFQKYIHAPYFFTHSVTSCVLIGTFSPFIFKVIINRWGLNAFSLIIFWVFCIPSLSLSLVLSPLMIWWFYFMYPSPCCGWTMTACEHDGGWSWHSAQLAAVTGHDYSLCTGE